MNSVVPEGLAVPVPQAIPVVLLLKDTNRRFYNENVTGHSGSLILQNYFFCCYDIYVQAFVSKGFILYFTLLFVKS